MGGRNVFIFFILGVQQVSDGAQLLGGRLEGFDLFSQLGLLGLLLAENLMDVFHARLLSGNVRWGA
jgi:hypothetical protein